MAKKINKMSDFTKFNDMEIQHLLKRVSNEQCARAIKGCSEKVVKKFYNNMSKRAADMVKEEIKSISKDTKKREAARNFLYKWGNQRMQQKERSAKEGKKAWDFLNEIKSNKRNISSLKLEDLATYLTSFSAIARRDGILALDKLVNDIDDDFVKAGIRLAVDGTDPELIDFMLGIRLETILSFQKRRLDMAKTLIMSIQAGDNPRIAEFKGRSYLENGV